MGSRVIALHSPSEVLDVAGAFLESEPVRHNLILTLLHTRVAYPEPGRYWIVEHDERVVGVAFQSPLYFFVTLTPMTADASRAVVDAIVDAGVELPGVNGEAAATAQFAGHWTERTGGAAIPTSGQRIYEYVDAVETPPTRGAHRRAGRDDRDVLVEWTGAFQREIDESRDDIERVVDVRLQARQLWLWEDDGPVAMVGLSAPVCGVTRVGPVYTPPTLRGRGYASALCAELSRGARARDRTCMLYTDLANPTSNALYRRIGYRAVAECLRYRFDTRADLTPA